MFAELGVVVQVKVVATTSEMIEMLGDVPEQIEEVKGLFETSGVGSTVTTYGTVRPAHPLAVGVIL